MTGLSASRIEKEVPLLLIFVPRGLFVCSKPETGVKKVCPFVVYKEEARVETQAVNDCLCLMTVGKSSTLLSYPVTGF